MVSPSKGTPSKPLSQQTLWPESLVSSDVSASSAQGRCLTFFSSTTNLSTVFAQNGTISSSLMRHNLDGSCHMRGTENDSSP
eukprot:752929-Hanusia_phi.AAC.4